MDHRTIEEQGLVDLYVRGALEGSERERFEAHFIDCPSCLEELEWAEDLAEAVQAAASEDLEASPPPELPGWLGWVVSLEPWRRRSLIAATVIAGLFLPFFLGRFLAQLDTSEPQLNTPLVYLSSVRGDEALSTLQRIPLPQSRKGHVVLVMEIGSEPGFEEYGARLLELDGEVLWTARGLLRSPDGGLTLTLPARFLESGDYRLLITGARDPAEPAIVASYAFRAVLDGD